MNQLKGYIKTTEDYDNFVSLLILRLKTNKLFSTNPMLDGFVIGFIVYNNFIKDCFIPDSRDSYISGGSEQQLELAIKWMNENEQELCEMLEMDKSLSETANSDNRLKGLFTSKLINL